MLNMRGSRYLCQRGSNFDFFSLVDEGRDDQYITIGPPANAI